MTSFIPGPQPISAISGVLSGGSLIGGIVSDYLIKSGRPAPFSEQVPISSPIPNPGRFENDAIGFSSGASNQLGSAIQNMHSDYLDAAHFFVDFVAGSGSRKRVYNSSSPQTKSLQKSAGFQQRMAAIGCADGKGFFGIGTWQAALNLSHDMLFSPTGVQVGGFGGAS